MKTRLEKLLSIKSMVTLATTMVFCVLSLRGVLASLDFMSTYARKVAQY